MEGGSPYTPQPHQRARAEPASTISLGRSSEKAAFGIPVSGCQQTAEGQWSQPRHLSLTLLKEPLKGEF